MMYQRIFYVVLLIACLSNPIFAMPIRIDQIITEVEAVFGDGSDSWTATTADGFSISAKPEIGFPGWVGARYGETITVAGGRVWGINDPAGPTLYSSQMGYSATFTFPDADDPSRFAESFVGVGEATVLAFVRDGPGAGHWRTDPTLQFTAEMFVQPGRTAFVPYVFTQLKLTSIPSPNAVPEPFSIVVWLGLLAFGGVVAKGKIRSRS